MDTNVIIITVLLVLVLIYCINAKSENYTWKPILFTPESLCKMYDLSPSQTSIGGTIKYIPTSDRNCPDSSFTYTYDLGQYVPEMSGPGCIQLNTINYPFCYNQGDKYVPNYDKINHTSF
jgi:hypothetical protein